MRRKNWGGLLPWLLILLFAASLVPLLLLGGYARPSADDYGYGILTHRALQEGGSLLEAVWHTAAGYYQSWQGSFTALGLMSLTPCIFSERLYFLTTAVMLFSLIFPTIKLTDTLVRRWLHGSWRQVVCLALPLLFLSIQYVPSALNSFYWWNGAAYYTFTYGVMLLYVERFLTLLKGGRYALLPGILCGVFIGGSNYVSGLLTVLLAGVFLLASLWRDRALRPAPAVLCASVLIPFLLNVAAPGNRVRQAVETSMPPVQAILFSVGRAVTDLLDWPNRLTVLICLAWIPLLYALAGNIQISFRLPAAFSLFTFLLFAAQNAPHYYAASSAGPLRLRNIVFFSCHWLILLNEWYWLGWVRRRFSRRFRPPEAVGRWARPVAAALLAVLIAQWGILRLDTVNTAESLRELTSGEAAAYAAQRDRRLEVLLDPAVPRPAFAPIRARPIFLYHNDITPDPRRWENHTLAEFYGKESVVLIAAARP